LKFFVDQNIPKLVVVWLRQKGFEIVTLSDVNLRGAEDLDIALFAMQNSLAVLTQDTDFTKIYYNRYRRKLTVIFVNTKEGTAQSVINALNEAHLRLNLKDVKNQLVLIKDRKIRVI